MTFCIGLTGGIGCGKSTVSDMFSKLGAGIIDADVIAHHLTQAQGAAVPAIRAAFGNEFIDDAGALNRDKMRSLIFSDSAAKQRLEDILHPLILSVAKSQLAQMNNVPYVVISVPLLSQSPAFQKLVQRILVVDCSEEHQIARVAERSRMKVKEVKAIIAQQAPRSVRIELADDVIRNDADLDTLAHQVSELHQRYVAGI